MRITSIFSIIEKKRLLQFYHCNSRFGFEA